ncbi:MAG: metallophosphoesterase family protein [Mesorhizobium sp.]
MDWTGWRFWRQRPGAKLDTVSRPRLDLGDATPAFPVYAIGDVHGCIALLEEAEDRIAADIGLAAPSPAGVAPLVVLLGDYVDRGPDSAAVLSHLARPCRHGLNRVALRGNHDEVFLNVLGDIDGLDDWIGFGGRETLLSYGIDIDHMTGRGRRDRAAIGEVLRESVPEAHVALLRSLPVSLRIGRHLFVHAGLRPGIPLDDQADEDLMWIREPFLSEHHGLPYTVVHGHTPVGVPVFAPGRIAIDTAAFATGKLTVLKLDGDAARVL